MRRVSLVVLAAAAAAFTTTVVTASASTSGAHEAQTFLQSRVAAALAGVHGSHTAAAAAGRHTRRLGELATTPINGDVWAHDGYAYVGAWGFPCDGRGVTIVDVSDPSAPRRVSAAAGYPATSAEDMHVMRVSTTAFTGDLLAVGIQGCDEGGVGGLALWDVTDPAHPEELGFFENFGVHELSLTERDDGVFALLAVPFSEPFTTLFLGEPVGDFQLVDVTDPEHPVLTDDWGALKDGGFPAGAPFLEDTPFDCGAPPCRGAFAAIFAHSASASADGETAYVAYWDLGGVVLDISDPHDITYVGRTVYPADSDGDTHSAVANGNGSLLATTDEDFSPFDAPHAPGDTWGFARLWSLANPASPAHLSDVTTPHSKQSNLGAIYSAHNPQFDGDKLYVSWYSDGLRVFDVSRPSAPREIASYRPPPHSGVLAPHPIPLVWGVHKVGNRIYLSDMFFGLYIVAEQ